MEAIDDSLNENIARSIAYSVLEYRQQHEFNALTPLCSKLLQQRIRFLGPPSGDEGWNSVIQWQEDDCPEVIDTCWSPNMQDKLYQQPVYYKRLDAETLNCVVEFAVRDKMHYAVMLVLEPDTADTSDLKYHNTRAYSQSEWKDIVHSWSRSLEHAEREFVRKLTHTSSAAPLASPQPEQTKMTPDDYWGDWESSEEEDNNEHDRAEAEGGKGRRSILETHSDVDQGHEEDSDSDDEYYSRWSKDPPGVLTPGPASSTSSIPTKAEREQHQRLLEPYSVFQKLDPQQTEQQEIQEEYDQSYNPLYTVPSVPDLMGMHTSALAELTNMLHASLPNQSLSHTVPVNIDPLPKVLQGRSPDPTITATAAAGSSKDQHVPGAYPADADMPEKENIQQQAVTTTLSSSWEKETGRALLNKGFRALVSVGKLLGFQGSEILEMVQEIVKSS